MKTSTVVTSTAWLLSGAKAAQFVMYTAGGDDTAVERADPILAPGTISQHVHQIFGSNAFAPAVSYESLQRADCTTVGDASGNGNAQDKSIYWHPALYMEASDGSGYIKVPTNGHKTYYKDAGTGMKREPFEFPQGFRMLAGNPFIRAANSDLPSQNITQWVCHGNNLYNQGTDGGFPTGVTDCDAYPGFNGALHYPHCWNGKDFDPANPTAHVVYPDNNIQDGPCPASHPTRLPHIFMENQFDLHSIVDEVKPDSFVLAMGDNTGYGWHADFYNGWDDGAIPELFNSCPQGQYGNEDIGSCPSFKKFSTPSDQCKLKTSYVEKVDAPGQNLPGCNPVIDTNPAPIFPIWPLGSYTTACKAGAKPPTSPPAQTSVVPAQSSPVTTATSPTTMTTTTKPAKTKTTTNAHPTHTRGSTISAISCPASNHKKFTMNGKQFQVECGTDHHGGDMKMVTAHSLGECVQACAKEATCVDVSLSGTACYMKSTLGATETNAGINGAKLVTSGTTGAQRRHLHDHAHGIHLGRRSH